MQEPLEGYIKESLTSAFIREMLTNSGHFLVLNGIAEAVSLGWQNYFFDPIHYLIIIAILIQAWYLSRPAANRFWGNLVGASIYTVGDLFIEGMEFFQDANHWILLGFAVSIAILQGGSCHWAKPIKNWLIPIESLVRIGMLLALYVNLKVMEDSVGTWHQMLPGKGTVSHQFLLGSLLFTGLLIGLQTLQVIQQQDKLQKTARILRDLAKWGMGSYAVKQAIADSQSWQFRRCQRAIVFMDIRGFTYWCEQHSADSVVRLLNSYYNSVEPAAAAFDPLRVTLTADEVMGIYETPQAAVAAAQNMQAAARNCLQGYGLGVGCGVHWGQVVEGWFGSSELRTYTAIGDVVNTASRLEKATPPGEITISDAVYQAISEDLAVKYCPPLVVKGKEAPLTVWRLSLDT